MEIERNQNGERRHEGCSGWEALADEAQFTEHRLFFPGRWTMQSFRKSRLLRNYGLVLSVGWSTFCCCQQVFCSASRAISGNSWIFHWYPLENIPARPRHVIPTASFIVLGTADTYFFFAPPRNDWYGTLESYWYFYSEAFRVTYLSSYCFEMVGRKLILKV